MMNDSFPIETLSNSPPESFDNPRVGEPEEVALLGAADIVEAFVVLRHELKLQVRNGRDLQQNVNESLQRLEQRLDAVRSIVSSSQTAKSSNDESRKFAELVVEVEESLHRAIDSLAVKADVRAATSTTPLSRFDQAFQQAPWLVRRLAAGLVSSLRLTVEDSMAATKRCEDSLAGSRQGLELMLLRMRRLMENCELQRVDVMNQPFDAETMHALDVVESCSVPRNHVAEQLRPAYRWQGKILRCADVRLSK